MADSVTVPQDLINARATALPIRLTGIDAVRAFAAGAVVLCHAVESFTVLDPTWVMGRDQSQIQTVDRLCNTLGTWGVAIFFVLSGLCIHLPAARSIAAGKQPALDVPTYFRRRFTRIYPPHFVALVLSAALALALPAGLLQQSHLTAPTVGLFAAHVMLVHTFVPGALFSISAVLWSIALEAHFYVLYPLLLRARRRVSMETLAVVLLGVSVVAKAAAKLWIAEEYRSIVLQSVACRWWEWVLGCVLAEWLARRPYRESAPLLPTIALVASWAVCVPLAFEARYAALLVYLWPVLCALALMAFVPVRSGFGSAAWIGGRAYSIYLLHPVGIALVVALGIRRYVALPLALCSAIGVSLVFYWGVERRFLQSRSHRDLVPSREGHARTNAA